MAIAATSQLLDDVRGAAGDRPFLQYDTHSARFSYAQFFFTCLLVFIYLSSSLRMMGISKGSGKALCFVIDTTKSMSDDIEAVRTVTSAIINTKVGTEDEPSFYILVPFSDPGRMDATNMKNSTKKTIWKKSANFNYDILKWLFCHVCFLCLQKWTSGIGPLIKTTDAQLFRDVVNSLSVTGGGDDEELSLSGLQVP